MDVAGLKRTLAELQQTNSTCGASANGLEVRPAYLMLLSLESTATGKTKREVMPAVEAYIELSAVYGLVSTALKEAESLLDARFILSARHEQIEAVLLGPSIKLPAGSISDGAKALLSPREISAGLTPARFLEVYAAAINNLNDTANRCNNAVLQLDTEIAAADTEVSRLEALAESLNLPVPSEVAAARQSAHNLKKKSETDPFGAFDDVAVEVTPLLQMADRHLQSASLKKDHAWQELDRSLNEFRKAAQQSSKPESATAAAAYEAAQKSLQARTDANETERLIAEYAMAALQ